MSQIVVLGDTLLDCDIDCDASRPMPDAAAMIVSEQTRRLHPGGAGLAATMIAADGHETILVTALGADAAGEALMKMLVDARVRLIDVGADGTTCEKIRIFAHERPLLRLDRGHLRPRRLNAAARRAIERAAGILVSDYGLGLSADLRARQSLTDAAAAGTPVIWDPHPKGAPPVPGTTIATPNRVEAALLSGIDVNGDDAAIPRAARGLREAWHCDNVCVTLGDHGAVTVTHDEIVVRTNTDAREGDPCGAGDRFATSLTAQLAAGRPIHAAITAAVAVASEFVAGQTRAGRSRLSTVTTNGRDLGFSGEDGPEWNRALQLVRSGAKVVATGGCFDMLHPGHVELLRSARALGDHLVVLLNSDRSVRALKGPSRPIMSAGERALILNALESVDCVLEFDDDTPETALRRLKPSVFAKGGDYHARAIPECRVMSELGGEVVILPFFGDSSSTRLIERVYGSRRPIRSVS
jgi:rfaE bifunctional protein nucleotidyltransferase chain/domain/rfaE bifunctional protein kinase chain/domain